MPAEKAVTPVRRPSPPKGKTVRAFPIENGYADLELPPGWMPFATTGYVIYAYKDKA